MGKRIGHRGNRRGCLHLAKPLIVCKEEGAIVRQRPPDRGTELVADECRYRGVTQIEVVPGVEYGISVKLEQRSMKMIAS